MTSSQQPSTVEEILGQLAGAASVCWQPKPTGVFDSEQASKFVDDAVAAINELRQSELEKARMSGAKLQLLHLKTWINLHGLDKPMIMKGIDHMSQSIEQQMLGEVSVEPHWKERLNEPE